MRLKGTGDPRLGSPLPPPGHMHPCTAGLGLPVRLSGEGCCGASGSTYMNEPISMAESSMSSPEEDAPRPRPVLLLRRLSKAIRSRSDCICTPSQVAPEAAQHKHQKQPSICTRSNHRISNTAYKSDAAPLHPHHILHLSNTLRNGKTLQNGNTPSGMGGHSGMGTHGQEWPSSRVPEEGMGTIVAKARGKTPFKSAQMPKEGIRTW